MGFCLSRDGAWVWSWCDSGVLVAYGSDLCNFSSKAVSLSKCSHRPPVE